MEVKRGDLTGQAIGRYKVEDFLGAGGMGEVYRAYDSTLRRTVAIKRLDPRLSGSQDSRLTLLKEAQNAACLNHQSIAAVHDVLDWEEELLLVLEYVEGYSLASLPKPVDLEPFLDYAVQCASALVAAHAKGIVHRDIKPGNIMLTRQGSQIKVLDFGIARRQSSSESAATTFFGESSAKNKIKGTLAYMAPEALTGRRVDERSDIFSLGVVFYELLTGHHPFQESTPAATIDRILHVSPGPAERLNPHVSPDLSRVVAKMLEKCVDDRYATAKDLLVDLRRSRREQTHTITEEDPLPSPHARTEPGPGSSALLVGLLAASILCVVLAFLLREDLTDRFNEWFVPLPEVKTVAILPFRAPGASVQDQAYAAGLSDELRRMMGGAGAENNIHFAPPELIRNAGVFKVAESIDFDVEAEAVAKEAGANLALAGTLRFEGEWIHFDLEVLDAHFHPKGASHAGHRLRRRRFSQENTNAFALLNRLRSETLAALELASGPVESAGPFRYGTFKGDVYLVFLRGLGNVLLANEEESINRGLDQLELAVTIDPRFARARALQGTAFLRKSEITENPQWLESALAACEAAIQMERDLAEGHFCMAQVALARKEVEQALQPLKDAYVLDPTREEVVLALGKTRFELGHRGLAEQVFRAAIDREPAYWRYHFELGDCFFLAGEFAKAIPHWNEAAKLAPSSWMVFRDLGLANAREARWDEARKALEKALEIGSVKPDRLGGILNNLATAYFFSGRLPEAVRAYEKAMAETTELNYLRMGNFADALYWSGSRKQAQERYLQAIGLAQKELAENPEELQAFRMMAKFYAMVGDQTKARQAISRLLEKSSEEPENRKAAAEVYQKLGERDEALKWIEKALQAGIHEAEIRNHPIFETLEGDPRYEALFEKSQ